MRGEPASLSSVMGGLAEAAKFKALCAGANLALHDALSDDGSVQSQVRRQDLLRKAEQARVEQENADPEFQSETGRGLYSGAISTVQQLPGMAASLALGNPAPALALGVANTALPAYSKYLERGASKTEAATGAGLEGALEYVTEKIPMSYVLDKFGKGKMGEFLKGYLFRELPSEQAATLTQDAVDTAIANPDKTWGEYWAERPAAAYQTALATAVQTGTMGVMHGGAQLAKQHYIDQIEPTYRPDTALGRALLQDINDIAFNPDATDQQARNALDPGRAQLTLYPYGASSRITDRPDDYAGPLSRAASRIAPSLVPSSTPPDSTSDPTQPSVTAAPVSQELQAILSGINQIDPADAAAQLQQQIDAQNPEPKPDRPPANPDWAAG